VAAPVNRAGRHRSIRAARSGFVPYAAVASRAPRNFRTAREKPVDGEPEFADFRPVSSDPPDGSQTEKQGRLRMHERHSNTAGARAHSGHGGCFGGLMVLALGLSTAVGATDAPALEEVTVTARKVAEPLQEIPLTITAFSANQLAERGIRDVRDLAAFTPGISFNTATDRSAGSFQTRGMSQVSGTGDTSRDILSVFIDGVYYAGATPGLTFEDLERVEVVKGPQSAFFGRATFGGAINFITATPGNTLKANIDARVGQYGDQAAGFSVEGPLVTDKLAARLTGNYADYDGQYRNAQGGGQLGAQREEFGALSLAFTPTDDLKARLRVSYTRQHDGAPAVQLLNRLPQFNCGPFGGTNNGGSARLYCGEVTFSGQPSLNPSLPTLGRGKWGFDDPGLRRTYKTATLNADWTLPGSYVLSLLAGWQKEHAETVADFERTSQDVWWSDSLRDQKATSEELRLSSPQDSRLRWLGGLYHLKQNYVTSGNFMVGTQNPFASFPGFFAGAVIVGAPSLRTIENKAAFGSVSYDLTDSLKLSLEGRWQKDEITSPQPGAADLVLGTNKFLPRFIADYRLNPNVKLYFNWAKGDQPTQGNAQVGQLSASNQARAAGLGLFLIVPEAEVTNFELGTKTTWNDGQVIANAAVYLLQWRGKQGVKGFQIDLNNNGIVDIAGTGANRENFNAQAYLAGDEDIYGIDFETRARLTDRFQMGFALGASHLKIKSLQDDLYRRFFGTLDASGQQEGLVPRVSGSLFAEYRRPLASRDASWFVRPDLTYLGKRFTSILNESFVGATTRVNLHVGVDLEHLNVTLYCENLLDDHHVTSATHQSDSATDPFAFLPSSNEVVLPRQRQVGVTAAYRF
jgi:iron complex outermembrane receptor protein